MRCSLIFVFLLSSLNAMAQQLPYRSAFSETSFVWNPALTGNRDFLEFGATYRRQWADYEQSPRTTNAFFQLPITNLNMSFGSHILHEEIGLFQNSGIHFSYAYHIRLHAKKQDRLSLGIAGNLSQLVFNGQHSIAGNPDDPLLLGEKVSSRQSNWGVGIHYTNGNHRHRYRNVWYASLAINQSLPKDLLLAENNRANLKRSLHANGSVGARFISGNSYFEPLIWVDYSQSNLFRVFSQLKMEWREVFWASLGYSTDGAMHMGVGFIVDGGFLQDGQLRLGMNGSYALGQIARYQGLGYEFYMAYRFYVP